MAQAILTRTLGVTSHRGNRIVAQCAAKRIVVPRGHKAQNLEDDHRDAAIELIKQLGWWGHWAQGTLPNGDYAFVCHEREHGTKETFKVLAGVV